MDFILHYLFAITAGMLVAIFCGGAESRQSVGICASPSRYGRPADAGSGGERLQR